MVVFSLLRPVFPWPVMIVCQALAAPQMFRHACLAAGAAAVGGWVK
jgi:hypothetical protein